MTQTQAGLWLLLGSLMWLGAGAALLTAWGTRDELLESFSKAVPGGRGLVASRPWLFSVILFFMAVGWPVTMRGYVKSLPRRVKARRQERRQARLDRKVKAHLERRTREFDQEQEGRQ